MKKDSLLLLLILCVFFSCRKYERGSYTVKGTVRYDSTGTPVQGIKIFLLLKSREAKGQSSYSISEIQSTETDSKGEYVIYYKKLHSSLYSYSVRPPNKPLQNSEGLPLYDKNSTIDFSIK